MKSYTEKLTFNTPEKISFSNITKDVNRALLKSNITEGLCLVNAMHITASVFINDDEEGLKKILKHGLKN